MERVKMMDERKRKLCEENSVRLIYYSSEVIKNESGDETLITSMDELISKIKST